MALRVLYTARREEPTGDLSEEVLIVNSIVVVVAINDINITAKS